MQIVAKGELHFDFDGNGFFCQELSKLPQKFEQVHGENEIQEAIRSHLIGLKSIFEIRVSDEEKDQIMDTEKFRRGGEVFDRVVNSISTEGLSRFQKFLFWLGDWWYYNPTLRTECRWVRDNYDVRGEIGKIISKYVVTILPEQIQQQVAKMGHANVAVGFGHFALMFVDNDQRLRRLITDTQLFELHDVSGYIYLDIGQDEKPVVRCCTSRGGGRAFFDGTRLMAHDRFQTCAPKTVFVNGGYKVNSTRVTIVNGNLFPLIDTEDAVAHTTGAWCGCVDFTTQQALDSYKLSEESGSRMKIEGGQVMLDGKALKPIGMFQPSQVKLLDSGFALYEWSEFHEIQNFRYDHVLVIDDSQEWIKKVERAFGTEIERLESVCTRNRTTALKKIIERKPEVVVLDMHLSVDERFEGLWIANQLFAQGFAGKIFLASSYPDEQLRAMAKLIHGPVEIPGKNIERIHKLLCSI